METLRKTRLDKLIPHLQNLEKTKLDLVVPAELLYMVDGKIVYQPSREVKNQLGKNEDFETLAELHNVDAVPFTVNNTAANQICNKLRIPRTFYRYLQEEHIDLLDTNVNKLFERSGKNYFVRSYINEGAGELRALLSDQFKVIDHLDVLGTTLEVIKNMGVEVEIGSCNLTEHNMHVEVISKTVIEHADDLLDRYRSPNRDKPDGDNRIFAGFVISNSETGQGRYRVQPRVMISKCDNGLIFKADALAATHLGSKMQSGIQWGEDTLSTEVELVGKQTRDAVQTFLSPEYLGRKVQHLQGFTKPLEQPTKAVNNICKKLNFSEEKLQDVMNYFVQGGDDSSLGVVNALTYHAHECDDADLQYEIEEESVGMLAQVEKLQYN